MDISETQPLLKFAGLHDFNMAKISKTPFKFKKFACETNPWRFSCVQDLIQH